MNTSTLNEVETVKATTIFSSDAFKVIAHHDGRYSIIDMNRFENKQNAADVERVVGRYIGLSYERQIEENEEFLSDLKALAAKF